MGGMSTSGGGQTCTMGSQVHFGQRQPPVPGEYQATLSLPVSMTVNGAKLVRTLTCAQALTVVPSDTPTVTLIQRPELQNQLQVMQATATLHRSSARGGKHLSINIGFRSIPMPLSFKVRGIAKRHDGSTIEVPLANMRFKSSGHILGTTHEVPVGFNAASITLVMTADHEAAEGTVDQVEAWDGEFTIPDVPIANR
jgi:hypothetical protein